MDLLAPLFNSYGLWALAVYVLWRDVWPAVRDNFSTAHKAKLEQEHAERERKAAIEAEDRKASREQNERLSKSLDRFSEQLGTFGLALTTVAERLTAIERDQEAMRWAMTVVADRMGVQIREINDG